MSKIINPTILLFLFLFSCKKEKQIVYDHVLFGEWVLTSQYFEGKEQVPLAIYKLAETVDTYIRDADGNIIYDISDTSMQMILGHQSQLVLDTALHFTNLKFIFMSKARSLYSSPNYSYEFKIALNDTDTLYGNWHLDLAKQDLSISADTVISNEDRWARHSGPLLSKFFNNVYIKNNVLYLANEIEEFVLTKQ